MCVFCLFRHKMFLYERSKLIKISHRGRLIFVKSNTNWKQINLFNLLEIYAMPITNVFFFTKLDKTVDALNNSMVSNECMSRHVCICSDKYNINVIINFNSNAMLSATLFRPCYFNQCVLSISWSLLGLLSVNSQCWRHHTVFMIVDISAPILNLTVVVISVTMTLIQIIYIDSYPVNKEHWQADATIIKLYWSNVQVLD